MVTIAGRLEDGLGNPIADCQIELKAQKNSSAVLVRTSAHSAPDGAGNYTMNVKPGIYAVRLLMDGCPPNDIGEINIYSDSKHGTLNDFLLNPVESEITPALLAQVTDERKQAQQAATNAQTSANNASTILDNSLKKGDYGVGGTAILLNDASLNHESGFYTYYAETTKNPPFQYGSAIVTKRGNGSSQVAFSSTELKAKIGVYLNNNWSYTDLITASNYSQYAVPLSGGTLTGNITFNGNGRGLYFSPSNHRIISGDRVNLSFDMVGSNGVRNGRLDWLTRTDTWNFKNSKVTINDTPVLKQGDYGLGAATQKNTTSIDLDTYDFPTGFYSGNNWVAKKNGLPFGTTATTDWFYLLNQNLASVGNKYKLQILGRAHEQRLAFRNWVGGVAKPFIELITTANSTIDANGFYKKASPIIRLFANDNIVEVEDLKKSGCGLVNNEAKDVTAKRIDIGHYEIHGSLGFAKEGWYITLPEDANGNKKFFAKYSVDANNVITVKTFTKKFDIATCEVVAGEPVDITADRWIDIRLAMSAKAEAVNPDHIEN